ncbi:MAG: DUF4430 domain-containing protein [Lachnospiraceae bacterium]|nr:DUF4430 domain-containing protein [Lachnospiraceae bacterium]
MQKNGSKKLLSFILCMALIVAMAFFTTGCNDNAGKDVGSGTGTSQTEAGVLGTGDTEFTLTVVDKEGGETQFEIHTDKETVGDALTELGFIEGEESEYGLYVKTVNGITADYDTDGVYWAFYINDEYASSGVDSTTITSGESYSFKVE